MANPATLKEIAASLGVAISTVSRALTDHPAISSETKRKVNMRVKEMDYQRNEVAASFQKGKTYTIGLILPTLSETFFSDALTGIEDAALKRNYMILAAQTHNDESMEIALVHKMRKLRVDGLLIATSKNTTSLKHFEKLSEFGLPVVFFDRIPPLFNIHSVSCNIEKATIDAIHFLIEKGHRRIGFINGPENLLSSRERINGYLKGLQDADISFNESLYTECDLTKEGAEQAVTKLLKANRGLSAVIAFNDYVAMYAMRKYRASNANPNCPVDFVSYSNLPILKYTDHRPIASIEQFPLQQGQIAMEILIDLMDAKSPAVKNGFKNIILEGKLIVHDKHR